MKCWYLKPHLSMTQAGWIDHFQKVCSDSSVLYQAICSMLECIELCYSLLRTKILFFTKSRIYSCLKSLTQLKIEGVGMEGGKELLGRSLIGIRILLKRVIPSSSLMFE